MNIVCEELNEELNEIYYYQTYIINFSFFNKNLDCNRLRDYLLSKSKKNSKDIFIMTGNGVLTAVVGDIFVSKNELHNKIVNYLTNVDKKSKSMYELEVVDICNLKHDDFEPFDYWLSISIYLIERRGEKWDYNFIMDSTDDIVNKIVNERYTENFRDSDLHYSIQEHQQYKKENRIHKTNMKLLILELDKYIFIKKIKTIFTFTDNKSCCLPKKKVCTLLGLDCKNKKDVMRLNIILAEYGVKYNKQKMINREYGVFIGIFLK